MLRRFRLKIWKKAPKVEFVIRQFGAPDPSAPDGFRRYTVYDEGQVKKLQKRYGNEDCYVSVYLYKSEDFDSCLISSPYFVDLDALDVNEALNEARKFIEVLLKLGIKKEDIRIFWSGAKGFHVEVPLEVFGGEPHRDLNKIWRTLTEYIEEYLGEKLSCLDWRIYDRRRLWRLPNSVNSKTGLYKIPLSVDEVLTLSVEEIKKLAKQPREIKAGTESIQPLPNLQEIWKELVHKVENPPIQSLKRVADRKPYDGDDPPCVQHLLELRMREGEGRNNAAIMLFCYLYNFRGLLEKEAVSQVQEWNSRQYEPLSDRELKSLIKSGAEKGYVYGCHTLEAYGCNRVTCPLIPKLMKPFTSETLEKAKKLLKEGNLWVCFNHLTDRWVVRDYSVRRSVARVYVSAFTDDPVNISLLGRDSIGKTYNAVVVGKLIPESIIWFLAGLSPTALAHDYGSYDQEKKAFIVDLWRRIMLFLEPPHQQTLQKLKPLLSHDKQEVSYKITDRSKGGRLRTTTTVVKGWPAVVMCAAKSGYVMEYSSRWLTATPEISETKTKEAMKKIAEVAENPEQFQEDENVKVWRAIFSTLANTAPIKVKIPYASILAEHFTVRGPETMRVFNLFLRLIKANAALHVYQRQRDGEYVVANLDDLQQVLEDFKPLAAPTFLGVSNDALNLYNALIGQENLTFHDIEWKAREVFGAETPESTLRDLYVERLVEAGFLEQKPDPNDRRRILYDAGDKPVEIKVFDDEAKVLEEVKLIIQGECDISRNRKTENVPSAAGLFSPEKPTLETEAHYRRIKPAEPCEQCEQHPVEYEIQLEDGSVLRRCPACFQKLRSLLAGVKVIENEG